MSLDQLLKDTFNPELSQAIAERYQRVYEINMASHNPIEGAHDNQSFGTLNWKTRCYLLRGLVDPAKGIYTAEKGKKFALHIGPFIVTPYNAGRGTLRNYWTAFPHNTNGAHRAAMENIYQLKIPFAGQDDVGEFDDRDCRNVILADMGDSINGVTALFVGVPNGTHKGRISSWSRIHVIWEREAGEIKLPPLEVATSEQAPVEHVSIPKIRLKPQNRQTNEQ